MKKLFALSMLVFLPLIVACGKQAAPKLDQKDIQQAPASQRLFSEDKNYAAKTWIKQEENHTQIIRVESEGQEVKAFAVTTIISGLDSKEQGEANQEEAYKFESEYGAVSGVEPRAEFKGDKVYLTYVVYMDRFDWEKAKDSVLFMDFVNKADGSLTLDQIESYAKEQKFEEVKDK